MISFNYCQFFSFYIVKKCNIMGKYNDENRLIGLIGRVFGNDPGDLGSIPGRVIPKT